MAEKVNRKTLVDQYRAMYPAGTVLELIASINDEYTPKDVEDLLLSLFLPWK